MCDIVFLLYVGTVLVGTSSSSIGIRRAAATGTLELGCDCRTIFDSRSILEYNDDLPSLKSETGQRGGDGVLGPVPFGEIVSPLPFRLAEYKALV